MRKMVISKRGLSEIVTTVLIILVVLAALVLIWSAVRPLLNKASSDIAGAEDCLVLDLEAVSCTEYGSGTVVDPKIASVSVRRGATEGDLTGIRFIFSDGTNSVTSDDSNVLNALQTRSYNSSLGTFNPTSVNVAALIGTEQKVCNPLSEPIVCS